jgi:uncharacterized membrane protein (UPF0127 family)
VHRISAVAALFVAASFCAQASPACDPDTAILMTADGAHAVRIEIADDPSEQARGLMFRSSMAEDAGMLFVFDPPRPASFWMHNTMIPLDMIFIDDSGRVESIVERRDTYSDRVSQSKGSVRAVLEINAGRSRELGLEPGDRVMHGAFTQAPEKFRCQQ